MSDFDLETLHTEWRSAVYELERTEKQAAQARVTEFHARSALVDAIIESGQIEYGNIVSYLELHEPSGEMRRKWRMK